MVDASANRIALICGVSGQDGAYLARLLLSKGYEVWGTSRDAQANAFSGLKSLGILDQVKILSMSPVNFRSVMQTITTVMPNEIYNLSGQSSVSLSFGQPLETMESVVLGTLNLLEAIRFIDKSIHFFNAGSSECFGDTQGNPADERTPFHPESPYAVAKSAATWQVSVYRQSYGLFACSGILFNHESPLRPERFVTRKITAAAYRIANGSGEKLALGDLSICRDWGWSPEYVEAMWRIMQHESPDDYVIATGVTQSLEDFLAAVFLEAGLNWREHVVVDASFRRPTDPLFSKGNPEKINRVLKWVPSTVGINVPRKLYQAECDK
jgi:GDPmannose 4,6-dehydratase